MGKKKTKKNYLFRQLLVSVNLAAVLWVLSLVSDGYKPCLDLGTLTEMLKEQTAFTVHVYIVLQKYVRIPNILIINYMMQYSTQSLCSALTCGVQSTNCCCWSDWRLAWSLTSWENVNCLYSSTHRRTKTPGNWQNHYNYTLFCTWTAPTWNVHYTVVPLGWEGV